MIDFDFEMNCSGCSACSNACPSGAIKMHTNASGFFVPIVDNKACINCEICDKVCLHLNDEREGEREEQTWLFYSKDSQAKYRSASGAAFYELAKAMLDCGGYVCGCIWDGNLQAKHIVSNAYDDLKKMQGSKYVQSDMNFVYKEIADLINQGKQVLFSGVPCQCVAIRNYINTLSDTVNRENLLTVGIICHGVPSPLAWESYKEWLNRKENDKLVDVNFRDKTREGYKTSYCRYDFRSGRSLYQPTYLPSSKYIEASLVYNLAIRESCSHCDAKGMNSKIDVLLGDWYAEYIGEGELGTSCIIAITENGKRYALDKLESMREFCYEEVLRKNPFVEKSVVLPPNREKFLNEVNDYKVWDKVEKFYPAKYSLKKLLVKTGLYNILKGKL